MKRFIIGLFIAAVAAITVGVFANNSFASESPRPAFISDPTFSR